MQAITGRLRRLGVGLKVYSLVLNGRHERGNLLRFDICLFHYARPLDQLCLDARRQLFG